MTPPRFPFVPGHGPGDATSWRDDLKHVAILRNTVHRRGVTAPALRNLLDYEVRLASFASLLPDEKSTLYQAVARGAGTVHAAVLCQRRWNSGAGGTIVMSEPGQPPIRVDTDDSNLAIPEWLDGLSLALIARDQATINTLTAPASIETCAQSAEVLDPYWEPYGKAFASAIVEPDTAKHWIQIALGALGEARIADPTRVELLDYPLISVLAALAERNTQAYNAALFEAIQKHRQYYAQPDQIRNWHGFFSLSLNGLCAAAFDVGLPVEVRTDYLLNDLISGNFPRELTAVTLHYPLRAIADADEARWFLDLEGIPRQNRQHSVVEHDGQVRARYVIRDAPGLSHAVAEFLLPADGKISANAAPALDAGELMYLAEVYSSGAGSDPQRRAALQDAIHCVKLALRRLPANRKSIKFQSRLGREYYEAEPGRFDRERLSAYLDSLKRDLASMNEALEGDATSSVPPRMSEDEARAGTLIAIEIIRVQVMPLLEALAHDEEGKIVEQIKPRDEDYARVFIGEAAQIAQKSYSALWKQEPPRTAQSMPDVVVRCFLTPAGMLADENDLSLQFPRGYRSIAHWLQPERIWLAWKYLAPGAQSGVAYNGLVWMDDHWAWFPKPFRVLSELADR